MIPFINLLIACSLFVTSISTSASGIMQGGIFYGGAQSVAGAPTTQSISRDLGGLDTASSLGLEARHVRLTLDGISFESQEARTDVVIAGQKYESVTNSIVTTTPDEYSAVIHFIQQSFDKASVAKRAGTQLDVNVVSVIPSNVEGEALRRKLESAFSSENLKHFVTVDLSQQNLTKLEKKMVERGGVLGALQKKMRAAANWMSTKPELYYRATFTVSRTLINGTAASIAFLHSYSGIHPAVAITAGIFAGSLSGILQFFASKYAPWLVRDGRTTKVTTSVLQKIMPFLSGPTLEKVGQKVSTLLKYSSLEVLFVLVPVSIFFLSDSFSNTLETSQWLTNIVGTGFTKFSYDFVLWKFAATVAASTFSQFPWDETISKLNSIDLEQNKHDPSHAAWIRFRTNGYFLGISALSVLAMAVSFGNVLAGYTIMGLLGTLGIYVGNRAVKKAQYLKATAEDFTIIPNAAPDTTFHVKTRMHKKIVNCESYLVKTGS